ncbi:hypothetical protein BJY00DRAFT_312154 [Aspergillus carlsbadensis]|nr:hypothetical protein BJY00DRAFT_312154 [Aspergillus carlsbadensis]
MAVPETPDWLRATYDPLHGPLIRASAVPNLVPGRQHVSHHLHPAESNLCYRAVDDPFILRLSRSSPRLGSTPMTR